MKFSARLEDKSTRSRGKSSICGWMEHLMCSLDEVKDFGRNKNRSLPGALPSFRWNSIKSCRKPRLSCLHPAECNLCFRLLSRGIKDAITAELRAIFIIFHSHFRMLKEKRRKTLDNRRNFRDCRRLSALPSSSGRLAGALLCLWDDTADINPSNVMAHRESFPEWHEKEICFRKTQKSSTWGYGKQNFAIFIKFLPEKNIPHVVNN